MQLDEYQQLVIEYPNNMLVLAGAGTGKTFCIINKIKYLKERYHANNKDFLIISFTNESVNDLKRKIGNDMDIFTFHKLALNILPTKYHLCSEDLLSYIIDEFFISMINSKEKRKLKRYFLHIYYSHLLVDKNFIGFKKVIFTFIKLMKANNLDIDYLKSLFYSEKKIFFISLIIKIFTIYEKEKESQNNIDLDDLIIKASLIKKGFHYKYIFVDEFQDTSQIRFNLIKNIYNQSQAKLFFFGDDFQSIYHFSGCNLNIMLDLQSLIPDIKTFKLRQTFRNSQELINIANQFIIKNPFQIKKDMISQKHIQNPIKIIFYHNPKKAFNKLIKQLDLNNTLVLGRNNNDIFKYTSNPKIRYLTVHKSKGLESENIILLNLSNDIYGFPNKLKNYYLLDKINKTDEIKYAEERRLFYVALTRTKNYIYILVPKNNPSIFIKELKKYL